MFLGVLKTMLRSQFSVSPRDPFRTVVWQLMFRTLSLCPKFAAMLAMRPVITDCDTFYRRCVCPDAFCGAMAITPLVIVSAILLAVANRWAFPGFSILTARFPILVAMFRGSLIGPPLT